MTGDTCEALCPRFPVCSCLIPLTFCPSLPASCSGKRISVHRISTLHGPLASAGGKPSRGAESGRRGKSQCFFPATSLHCCSIWSWLPPSTAQLPPALSGLWCPVTLCHWGMESDFLNCWSPGASTSLLGSHGPAHTAVSSSCTAAFSVEPSGCILSCQDPDCYYCL